MTTATIGTLKPFDKSQLPEDGTAVPVYSVRAYAYGIKSRARKYDRHQISIGDFYAENFALNLDEVERLAKEKVKAHMKLIAPGRSVQVQCSYETVKKDGGFVSTEMRLFDERNIKLTCEPEQL